MAIGHRSEEILCELILAHPCSLTYPPKDIRALIQLRKKRLIKYTAVFNACTESTSYIVRLNLGGSNDEPSAPT